MLNDFYRFLCFFLQLINKFDWNYFQLSIRRKRRDRHRASEKEMRVPIHCMKSIRVTREVTASIPWHAVMLCMQCMFQISCSHDKFQKENQAKKNKTRGSKSYKVAFVCWYLFDHFGVGSAPRDTLKQSIADQNGFWSNFDGF